MLKPETRLYINRLSDALRTSFEWIVKSDREGSIDDIAEAWASLTASALQDVRLMTSPLFDNTQPFLPFIETHTIRTSRFRVAVDRVVLDLGNRRDASEWQEEAEMVRHLGVAAGEKFARGQFLCLDHLAVRGEHELALALGGLGARLQDREAGGRLAGRRDDQVDVATQERRARHVRWVGGPGPEFLQGRELEPERGQELIWEFFPAERISH
jgi:hypothetical protein